MVTPGLPGRGLGAGSDDLQGVRSGSTAQGHRFGTRGKSMNLVIVPEKRNPANPPRHYRFEARLEGDDHILCVSHQPFVDAARVLVVSAASHPQKGPPASSPLFASAGCYGSPWQRWIA